MNPDRGGIVVLGATPGGSLRLARNTIYVPRLEIKPILMCYGVSLVQKSESKEGRENE
jgi:hypothetical protein